MMNGIDVCMWCDENSASYYSITPDVV